MKRLIALVLVLLFLSAGMAEGIGIVQEGNAPSEAIEGLLPAGETAPATEEAPLYAANAKAAKVISVKKKATKEVYLGTAYRIEVPGKKVKSFKSGNKKVAKVSKAGLVTLKKVGTAKITVTLSTKKSFVLTLKVLDPTVPAKVTITEGSKGTLTVGKPFQLTATVKPATASQKVKWKSSKTSVATVNAKGLVTPKKAGAAKITATAGKVKATFTATVKRDGRVELSQYYYKDVVEAAKKLDGFKRVSVAGNYYTYSDGNVSIAEYREGSYRSGIGYIHVQNTDRYTLFGVHVGMARDEARALMKKFEGVGDYYEYGDWVTYTPFYPDEDWFTLRFESGKVLEMTLHNFTDY